MAGCDWEHNGEWVREGSPEAYTQSAQQSAEMAAASARDAAKSAEDTSATLAQANQDIADALASVGPIVQQEVINNRELLLQLTNEARDQAVTEIQTVGQSNVSSVNAAGASQVQSIGIATNEAKADLLDYKGQLADDLAPLVSAAEACRDAACACSVNAAASEGNAGRSATAAETSAANANASAQAAQASEAAAAASQTAAARDAQSIGNAAAQIEANRLAIAAETSRAQSIESSISASVTAEQTRAEAAESALSGDIAKCVKSVNEQLPDNNGNVNISGVPVGTIIWSAVPNAPHGFLVCDGSIVGRATYPELFAAIGTTYGAGDGVSTFTLPNLMEKVVWGSLTVGTEKEAGLPNITGGFSLQNDKFTSWSAPFDKGTQSTRYTNGINSGGSGTGNLLFNASLANPIYGNSTTVQPPALTLLPCIKAYEAVVDDGTVVVSELARDVDRKEEVVESGDGYVRYDSGLQMCWGTVSNFNSGRATISFGKPFINAIYSVTLNPISSVANVSCVKVVQRNISNVDIGAYYMNGSTVASSVVPCTFIAIGRWK